MEDKQIIELYWARSEQALTETAARHGPYCRSIAWHILHDREDSEECVNDAWLQAWNSIPPQRPRKLAVFLGKITRNLALNRWEARTAEKRGGGQVPLALEELRDCLPSSDNTAAWVDRQVLAEALDRFLAALPSETRTIFMRRYWYLDSIREIAAGFGLSESKVKMSLLRSRQKLKQVLEKEGIAL